MIFKVTYFSSGLKVKGYLGLPNDIKVTSREVKEFFRFLAVEEVSLSIIGPKRSLASSVLPAFLYCRGGIGKFGRVKPSWVEAFANEGYVVFAPCYRGHEGGEGRDEFGGQDEEDVHSALQLLASLPFIDKGKISIMGFSRGSINATKTATKYPVHKLILWGGVSSLKQTYEERIDLRKMLKRVVGGTPSKVPDAYEDRSPIFYIEKILCPVLIMHGSNDVQVDVSHGLNMYEKLKESGKSVTLHYFEGYGHHLPYLLHVQAISEMFRWVEQQM